MIERCINKDEFVSLSMTGEFSFLTSSCSSFPLKHAVRFSSSVRIGGRLRVLELFGVIRSYSFSHRDPISLRLFYRVFCVVEYSDRVTYISLFSELGYHYEDFNSPLV